MFVLTRHQKLITAMQNILMIVGIWLISNLAVGDRQIGRVANSAGKNIQ